MNISRYVLTEDALAQCTRCECGFKDGELTVKQSMDTEVFAAVIEQLKHSWLKDQESMQSACFKNFECGIEEHNTRAYYFLLTENDRSFVLRVIPTGDAVIELILLPDAAS